MQSRLTCLHRQNQWHRHLQVFWVSQQKRSKTQSATLCVFLGSCFKSTDLPAKSDVGKHHIRIYTFILYTFISIHIYMHIYCMSILSDELSKKKLARWNWPSHPSFMFGIMFLPVVWWDWFLIPSTWSWSTTSKCGFKFKASQTLQGWWASSFASSVVAVV